MDDLLEALQIFRKYHNPSHPTNCSHDLLWVDSVAAEEMSDADVARLEALGFFYSEYHEGWSSYRFGSC